MTMTITITIAIAITMTIAITLIVAIVRDMSVSMISWSSRFDDLVSRANVYRYCLDRPYG